VQHRLRAPHRPRFALLLPREEAEVRGHILGSRREEVYRVNTLDPVVEEVRWVNTPDPAGEEVHLLALLLSGVGRGEGRVSLEELCEGVMGSRKGRRGGGRRGCPRGGAATVGPAAGWEKPPIPPKNAVMRPLCCKMQHLLWLQCAPDLHFADADAYTSYARDGLRAPAMDAFRHSIRILVRKRRCEREYHITMPSESRYARVGPTTTANVTSWSSTAQSSSAGGVAGA
jgi:hypothetical protein